MNFLTRGYDFGATELVTNTKLHTLLESCSMYFASLPTTAGQIGTNNFMLTSLTSSYGFFPSYTQKRGIADVATNASIINAGAGDFLKLYATTYMSIASIANAYTGQQIVLYKAQASFPALIDVSPFLLAGNWGGTLGSTLTLVWDGTNFIEICRTSP